MRFIREQGGFSLMEILVAIVVFSVGMVGVALMQMKGSQFTRQAGMRGEVVVQARALAEAMRANAAGVWGVAAVADIANRHGDPSGSYYTFEGSTAPSIAGCANQACVRAKQDVAAWIDQLRGAVSPPRNASGANGSGELASIKVDAARGALIVTTTWDPLSTGTRAAEGAESYAFIFQP